MFKINQSCKIYASLSLVVFFCVACSAMAPRPSVPLPGAAAQPVEMANVKEETMKAAGVAPAPMSTAGSYSVANAADSEAEPGKRLVIKNVEMSIVSKDPVKNMDEISNMAEQMEGFVVSSNRVQRRLESGEEVPQCTVVIRVPAERLNEALEKIKSNVIKVEHENVSGQDVTKEYTDSQSRLRNLEAAETELRKIMANAYSTEDVMNVYNQLVQVREQIELVKGQIQYYEQSSAFSAISIEILAESSVQPLSIGGWQPVGVARDAVQALINAFKFLASFAIWIILFFLPLAIIIYIPIRIIWGLIRRWNAKRKEKKQMKVAEAKSHVEGMDSSQPETSTNNKE